MREARKRHRGLSCALLAFAGLPAARCGFTDGSALVQSVVSHSATVFRRGAGVEAAWEAKIHVEALGSKKHRQVSRPVQLLMWPNLGDVWDDVREGANNLTDQVGDVTDDPAHQAHGTEHQLSEEVSIIAKALSSALETIQMQFDSVLNATMQDKLDMMTALSWPAGSPQPVLAEFLPRFEDELVELLGSAQVRWNIVEDVLDTSTTSIAGGLEAAGQTSLARNLRLNMKIAQRKVDYFLRALSDTKMEVKGSSSLPIGAFGDRLLAANNKLNDALVYAGHFVTLFQQAFMDLMDTIANAAFWSQGDINHIFGSVQHDVTNVAWRARSASRELVLGARTVVSAVSKRVGVRLPKWEPVSMPLLQSSAPARGGHFLVALLAVLAFLTS